VSIDLDLIRQKRYAEISEQYEPQRLTPASRYLYGYALLKTQAYWVALQIFWSLTAKAYPALKEECAQIIRGLVQDPRFTFSGFSSEELVTLFTIADTLLEQGLRSRVRTQLQVFLWQQAEYTCLERILKLSSEPRSGRWLENLSKVTFFQARQLVPGPRKCFIEPLCFIGHILTGGASLMARKAEYHQDMPEALAALAQELKLLFEPLKHQRAVTWTQTTWDHYVDFEAHMLGLILEAALPLPDCDIIPSPSYMLSGHFNKAWLTERILTITQAHPALRECYTPEIYHALFWAVTGDRALVKHPLLKTYKNIVNPYFRMALWLRAEREGMSMWREHIRPQDFETLSVQDHRLRVLVLQVWHSWSAIKAETPLSPAFIDKFKSFIIWFPEFAVEFQDNGLKNTPESLTSILCFDDPFKILGVSVTDSKSVIMQAVMQGIRKCPERMAVFRAAQDQLFHPARRFVQEYLRCFVVEDLPLETEPVTAPATASLQDLPLRSELIDAVL
jgi:hypothetical protein